ncbi:branched-chain amino acid ABC transporter permease [Nocardioides halotolerans]|uniref:branched-chain amino acid ABC transporter permease n=1 Tax=Nocardioides halotolerans TaxID=433660 RepID=UPI000491BC65|nr:branched-chain amino acid ABC transporter permease [Nocardioides halotolerans]
MQLLGQQTINGIALGMVFALFAMGFSLVIANLSVFHVAHAAVFSWGAVFAWDLTDRFGLPLVVALPGAALLAGVLNVLCYFVLIRHLDSRRDKELAAFISSVGGGIILTELISKHLNYVTVRLPDGLFPIRSWRVWGLQISSIQLLIVGVAGVTVVLLGLLMTRTQIGREVRAVAYDRELASMLGVGATSVSALVFFLSGVLAGVAAVLIALAFSQIDSRQGNAYLVLALTAMVLGGFGSVKGVVVGGLVVGLASSYTTAYLSSGYRNVVIFGLLMLVLVVRPQGLFAVPSSEIRV